MLASEMAEKYTAEELVGKRVNTVPFGDWPGGVATILEVDPDDSAPEIVFTVQLVTPAYGPSGDELYDGEIGVFEYEEVSFAEAGVETL